MAIRSTCRTNWSAAAFRPSSSGDAEGMLKELKTNLDLLSTGDFEYIMSPCASCTSCIKEYWPQYAARPGAREEKLARETA